MVLHDPFPNKQCFLDLKIEKDLERLNLRRRSAHEHYAKRALLCFGFDAGRSACGLEVLVVAGKLPLTRKWMGPFGR